MAIVHKFGGTSVGTACMFKRVVEIITKTESSSKCDPHIIVVSAMGGSPKVTDLLIAYVQHARAGDTESMKDLLSQIQKKHIDVVQIITCEARRKEIICSLEQDWIDMEAMGHALSILGSIDESVMEKMVGYGELWSARVLTGFLQDAGQDFFFLDARKVIKVHKEEGKRRVLWEETATCWEKVVGKNMQVVMTGFIASDQDNKPTTLLRDGSDFSASIIANIVNAHQLTIWTDVNGVLSADPRRVPRAISVPALSYAEAMELAYFGAKVLHPQTMAPVVSKKIPIYIRNTFEPTHVGTCIGPKKKRVRGEISDDDVFALHIVSGFSTVDDLALLNVEGSGMVGICGVASRLFGTLEKESINVVLIAQASSEHSICFAIPMHRVEDATRSLKAAFFREMHEKTIESISCISPVSVIAAVGDNMHAIPGVCARFFDALYQGRINILAISQGSSERNISAVVHSKDSGPALRAAHAYFFIPEKILTIGIVTNASSNLDTTLVQQMESQRIELKKRYQVELRIRGVFNVDKQWLSKHNIGLGLKGDTANECTGSVIDLVHHIQEDRMSHWLLIDLTQSSELVQHYPEWMDARMHVISCNRMAPSCSSEIFQIMTEKKRQCNLHMEPCLGTGLPAFSLLRHLIQTGDTVTSLQCHFSPLAHYIDDAMANSTSPSFEKVLRDYLAAQQSNGYCNTLMELVDELSGWSSARQLLSMVREINTKLDMKDISIHGYITPTCRNAVLEMSTEDGIMFLQAEYLKKENSGVRNRSTDGQGRLVARMVKGKCSVRWETNFHNQNPLQAISSDQIALAVTTERLPSPMCLHGAGQSSATVASDIFSCLMTVARDLGARDQGASKE